MAHFIGYLQGNRGGVSRLGTKASSMDVSGHGWNLSALLFMFTTTKKRKRTGFQSDSRVAAIALVEIATLESFGARANNLFALNSQYGTCPGSTPGLALTKKGIT